MGKENPVLIFERVYTELILIQPTTLALFWPRQTFQICTILVTQAKAACLITIKDAIPS